MAKLTNCIKEDVSDDIDKAKALKRKTRKVLKDPSKAGEVADELSADSVDAPEGAESGDEDVVSANVGDTGEGVPPEGGEGTVDDEDAASGAEDETPDLGTFLEKALANSKEAIAKYEKSLAEMKERIKDMGIEVPGLLDPEDVADEQTPEEFPPEIEGPDAGAGEGGEEEGEPPADGGEGVEGDEGEEGGEVPPEGGEGGEPPVDGDEGGTEEVAPAGNESETTPVPTKEVNATIAAPAKTRGTKLK